MSLSLLASRSMISTDRRHIDPNPDRLPINLNTSSSSNPSSSTITTTSTSTPKPSSVSSSLLLLSTSAEAAVLESQTLTPLHHHLNNKRDHKHAHLFKCEKCPKVYRHPQCLVKHRWEHTSYWADASKLMLSKHQQVQMLEAAAILATPSGSLPESRSLWPAAVSPSEAGLLGSDQVNLDVIQSQSKSYKPADHQQHRSSSSPCSSVLTASTPIAMKISKAGSEDIEMDEEEDEEEEIETGDEEEEDEIMFEMSINGDDSQSSTSQAETGSGSSAEKGRVMKEVQNSRSLPISFSISAPPPMGYFQPRPTTLTTTLVQDVRKEPVQAFLAGFPHPPTPSVCSVGRSYYHPETVFNPPPYADSGLRFQDQRILEENGNQVVEQEEEDEEDEDEDVGFGVREVGGMNGSGDEVIGMEL
ncbi:uncharacterized protein MELLADRAFT_116722 [Melampsora larici-populina 98AG31]|uniref:C2H2-type domain-containing protein n=1 Tax=Melampsora larici-populina (strain 98AG31 / pathotype 3-4-7) TaxID=747676 RepID=F4RPC7_MELLP|nr:uncharacterized protein MELLADRAFT_116722 [Melampsora larici-populina 98AG31]EGG05793.1 hypothetical protein MELLADRAFT_116722 [Melampsora larici-populina 98AG31]